MKAYQHLTVIFLLAGSVGISVLGTHGTNPPSPFYMPDGTVATDLLLEDTAAPTVPQHQDDRPDTGGEDFASANSPVLTAGADAGEKYLKDIIFLGDSTTYHMIHREVLPGAKNTDQVWTPSSGTLTLSYACSAKIYYPDTGEELTVFDAVSRRQPKVLVITLGVNGVSFMDEADFSTVFTMLINGIRRESPGTAIVLQSIFPRAEAVAENYEKITQQMIDTANSWILQICTDCGVKFLDTQTVLKNERGYLREEYAAGDGLHISRTGYETILAYVRTHPVPNI